MHRKLAHFLTMLATVMGSLSRAEAALALTPASAAGVVQARTALRSLIPVQYRTPTAPSGLAASPAGLSVLLTWTNNATIPAATGIRIERATDAGFTKNVTDFTVGPNATNYTDTSVVAGTTYRYRAQAQNLAGASQWSNVVSILRPTSSAPLSFFGPQFDCSSYCAGSFGWSENTAVTTADSVPANTSFTNMLRVVYPQGSIDSGSVATLGRPLGGAQAAIPFSAGATSQVTTLRYYLRPQQGFQPVKGGKLPGLYGGNTSVASGGRNPDGTNGWTARLMWRKDNNGEVYAYLADTDGYGEQLGAATGRGSPASGPKCRKP